ncbi:DUF397 domain-containing protein [Streptomyces sp. NPDC096105]|uniref:DUF397 domain-containing protein n=1 Tax=Streptomyces sp. NPDC096105 TaxID=3366074 RepID=UPI00382B0525
MRGDHDAARSDRPSAEIATNPATVHVRDSQNADGPRLSFAPAAWADFVPYARKG